ncbi:MAG: 1-aminocyclopropane-1-carboxylate deaminase/D-cysteine desulfhydrase [Gemmatimonadota bacterium]
MNPPPLTRLAGWPRHPLANLPTPLLPLSHLPGEAGWDGAGLFVKMDAETGFALGGNKVRKLEFELAPQRLEGITHLLTAGGPQSNHCRVTAAAAAHLGLPCTLVVNGPEPEPPRGNALLHRLFGARIHTVKKREDRAPALERLAGEMAEAGERPMVVPIGASTPLGSLGYARAMVELASQLEELPPAERTWIFSSASSCGTTAGLLLGISLLERRDIRLVGVSADAPAFEIRTRTVELAREAGRLLGFGGEILEGALAAAEEYVGEGYGIPTPASREALELFARTEGVVLDPVYTAKAAAGMLDWLGRGSVPRRHRVVFLHTGGHPALFA